MTLHKWYTVSITTKISKDEQVALNHPSSAVALNERDGFKIIAETLSEHHQVVLKLWTEMQEAYKTNWTTEKNAALFSSSEKFLVVGAYVR